MQVLIRTIVFTEEEWAKWEVCMTSFLGQCFNKVVYGSDSETWSRGFWDAIICNGPYGTHEMTAIALRFILTVINYSLSWVLVCSERHSWF